MEHRKEELYSQAIPAGKRRYFFDVHLYKEDFEKFRKGLDNAITFIETGIEPEPVVPENQFSSYDEGEKNEQNFDNEAKDPSYTIDDIDFKY